MGFSNQFAVQKFQAAHVADGSEAATPTDQRRGSYSSDSVAKL
jgi:hypothetical protein